MLGAELAYTLQFIIITRIELAHSLIACVYTLRTKETALYNFDQTAKATVI